MTSLLTQSLTDWDCIFIDDASDDATWQRAQTAIGEDGRFTAIRNATRQRQVGAFLQAWPQMRGDILVELDGDDRFCSPDALAEIAACYAADDAVDATSGRNRSTLGFESPSWVGQTRPARWNDLSASMCAPRSWRRSLQAQAMVEMPGVYYGPDGRPWQSAGDLALFAPVLSLARRIASTANPVYEVNMANPESDWVVDSRGQSDCAAAIIEAWRQRGLTIDVAAK